MRIVQVSAHFPPEFVSGGTLQPQRLARALRADGHSVQVLAGSLDGERAPLSVWDDADETGLPVRWVAAGEFVWWDDVRNYDNPPVEAIAAELYREWRPDVVHCHSLQTLGVGPIDAAADLGIPVVLTMHDFWWLCARQFLVDTDDRPCPLVVASSDCPCEAGRAHLDARARRLRETLDTVALILAPSHAAAEVLIANGVDPARVEVDENGVPDPSAPAPRHGRDASVRLTVRYTGGGNTLKGADVLLDALARTGPLQHVRVVAHNLDEALERRGVDARDVPAELEPPYPPDELDAVLADTDVLLLPSVARETYSIVTREALARGVPVIATDVLGPEEVVEHDRNGAVIPAGDADALAAELLALDADPARAARWRAGIGPVTLRSVEQQATDLVAQYRSVRSTPPRPVTSPANVLFVVGIGGAPLRYRAQLPAEAIEGVGGHAVVRHYLDPDLEDAAAGATHVVVYRVPATPTVLAHIRAWRARGIPVAFDADDLIFDPAVADEVSALRLLPDDEAALWLEGVHRYRTTLEACDAYIGSTARLVQHARDAVGIPAFLFENGVGQALGAASDRALRRPRAAGPLRVGYLSGTTTHDDDWRSVAPSVLQVLEAHPDVELWLGGHLVIDDVVSATLGTRLRQIPFLEWDELPEVLRDLDINLAPLELGSVFNDAKSSIKWLEAALCETPTIASPTEPFRRAIDDGVTGRVADGPADWEAALTQLLADAGARARMGRHARRAALLTLSPPLQGRRYLDVLDGVATAHRQGRDTARAWTPVVRDERPARERMPLDAYPPVDAEVRQAVSARAAHAARQAARGGRGRVVLRSLHEDGARRTARRVAAALGRRIIGRRR
ncbi:MAG: glycosyltransferase [Microthrixaceae bacterium]